MRHCKTSSHRSNSIEDKVLTKLSRKIRLIKILSYCHDTPQRLNNNLYFVFQLTIDPNTKVSITLPFTKKLAKPRHIIFTLFPIMHTLLVEVSIALTTLSL